MADYVPAKTPGQEFTMTASAAITGGQLVRVSGSNTVAPTSAASADWLGVAAADVASGALVTVFTGGVQRLTASGSISAGANVEGAASGQVASHTNGTADANIVGLALTAATNGNPVLVQLLRG
jgi:predicted RecA/RadA family phage recombinase